MIPIGQPAENLAGRTRATRSNEIDAPIRTSRVLFGSIHGRGSQSLSTRVSLSSIRSSKIHSPPRLLFPRAHWTLLGRAVHPTLPSLSPPAVSAVREADRITDVSGDTTQPVVSFLRVDDDHGRHELELQEHQHRSWLVLAKRPASRSFPAVRFQHRGLVIAVFLLSTGPRHPAPATCSCPFLIQ